MTMSLKIKITTKVGNFDKIRAPSQPRMMPIVAYAHKLIYLSMS